MPITTGQGNPDWTEDETILALDVLLRNYPRIPGRDNDDVREISSLLQRLPVHQGERRNETFRNCDGVSLKIQNLLSLHPDKAKRKGLRTTTTERKVWEKYFSRQDELYAVAQQIRSGIALLDYDGEPPEDDDGSEEGAIALRVHRSRERKGRKYRPRVIQRVTKQYGSVQCEACRTAPFASDVPQQIAEALYEVHHITPLSEVVGTTTTRLRDLVLLCANCHRLLHAICRRDKKWLRVEELRDWLSRSTTLRSSRE